MKIRDLDALAEACDALGFVLQREKTTYAWWGRYMNDSRAYGEHAPDEMGRCDHAIAIKGDQPQNGAAGPWEIAVVKAKDGDGFNLYYDQFGAAGARLTAVVGPDANRLRQEYAAAVATRRARAKLAPKGFRIARETLGDGRIKLHLRRA